MSEKKTTAAKAVAETAAEAKSTGTVVYCGPTIRGVARQFAPFVGGVPESVQKLVAKYPAAAALIVPLEDFARVRANIEANKGAESALVRHITKLVKEG